MRHLLSLLFLIGLASCDSKDSDKNSRAANASSAADDSKPAPPADTAKASEGGDQSFAQAMQIICDSPMADEVKGTAPAERAVSIAMHIEKKVTNKRVNSAFEALSIMSLEERLTAMQALADEAEIGSCALLSTLASAAASDAPSEVQEDQGDEDMQAGSAEAAGEESEQTIPFESHYLGKHKLGVNRVNDGNRNGEGSIVREANALVLQASVKKDDYYLEIFGIVKPVSKNEFVLEGTISGIPDLSWRDVQPAKVSTQGQFTFRATKGRRFWRLYDVDGVECVCNDNCGNEFCYIDLSF